MEVKCCTTWNPQCQCDRCRELRRRTATAENGSHPISKSRPRLHLLLLAILLGVFLLSSIMEDAAAIGRRRRWRAVNYRTRYAYAAASVYGSPQDAAADKASRCAELGWCGHLSGGYGGGNAEGVGFSSWSAQAALNNCCFTGQRIVAGSAVVRGAGGWYAVKIFW